MRKRSDCTHVYKSLSYYRDAMTRLTLITTARQVTQADLDNLAQLDAQIYRLRQMRDEIAANALRRIAAGWDVEDGSRKIDVIESFPEGVRKQELKVW